MDSRSDRLSARQLGALALTAAGLPLSRLCCRVSWPWVLAGSAAAALTLALLARATRNGASTVRLRRLSAPLLAAGALLAAWESSFAFPETAGNLLAAALVLGLAGAAAWAGPAAAGRCAALLLWVTEILYGTVLVFSLPEINPAWLRPAGSPRDALAVWGALLPPGAAILLRDRLGEDRRLPVWPLWAAAGGAAAMSAVTGGILSPVLARDPEAFRTLATGVSVLGVVRRFEALVNGAMLISGFCLCTLLLTAAELATPCSGVLKKVRKRLEKMKKRC